MKYETFKYKNYSNCSFYVGNYIYNHDAMFIQIISQEGELIATCTVNSGDYLYFENTATIKNYTENVGMTDFLIHLGVIEQVLSKSYFDAGRKESIDYCDINIEILKKYSSKFEYEW